MKTKLTRVYKHSVKTSRSWTQAGFYCPLAAIMDFVYFYLHRFWHSLAWCPTSEYWPEISPPSAQLSVNGFLLSSVQVLLSNLTFAEFHSSCLCLIFIFDYYKSVLLIYLVKKWSRQMSIKIPTTDKQNTAD